MTVTAEAATAVNTTIDPLQTVVAAALRDGGPAPELDRYLDAASACFARFGLERTSVPDVARELGVSRATVYRTIGTVDDMARLLVDRDLRRLVADALSDAQGPLPERAVAMLDALLTSVTTHPVFSKLLAHEADLVRTRLLEGWPELLSQVRPPLRRGLALAMDAGLLRRGDPDLLAEAIARFALSLALTPPERPRPLIEAVVLPLLAPEPLDH